MKALLIPLCASLLLFAGCGAGDGDSLSGAASFQRSSTENQTTLAALINRYRAENRLPAIPLSISLNLVAEAHVADLENTGIAGKGVCNLHSWSDQGSWTSCCYTPDHAHSRCMWDKPREISGGLYRGNGYEISAKTSGTMTPRKALQMWKASPEHVDVLLNNQSWKRMQWRAMGVAVSAHHAVVWFGADSDPAGNTMPQATTGPSD